ncbi:MAG: DUF202 domain-containing protein [Christensenellales bacterium]|jgi:putative membrane protein
MKNRLTEARKQEIERQRYIDVLSIKRTQLSVERTLLSYFRTFLGLVATGAALIKLIEDTLIIAFGYLLIGLSMLTLVVGLVRFVYLRKFINEIIHSQNYEEDEDD